MEYYITIRDTTMKVLRFKSLSVAHRLLRDLNFSERCMLSRETSI